MRTMSPGATVNACVIGLVVEPTGLIRSASIRRDARYPRMAACRSGTTAEGDVPVGAHPVGPAARRIRIPESTCRGTDHETKREDFEREAIPHLDLLYRYGMRLTGD